MSDQNPVFIPGPTNIPDRLRRAMMMQTRDHRAPDFVETLRPVLDLSKKVFGTKDGQIITFPSSGTGGWEAAVSNTLSPGDKVLIARYGMFSHRWIDLCQRHGLDVQIIECDWGTGAPAAEFEKVLKADTTHAIKSVMVTHNETATGVMSDIGAVRRAMDAAGHPALLMVDAVSSLASVPFKMDEWGVDICVAGSQKGFMLTTGMAILAVSPKALAAMETAKLPRTFFDFRDMMKANASGGFPYTPPLQLIFGLKESLDMLFEEGLENVYARHHRLASAGERDERAFETGAQVVSRGCQAEHRHHLGGGRDVEARLTRIAVARPTQANRDIAQRAIVHVHHALPDDAAHIDAEVRRTLIAEQECGEGTTASGKEKCGGQLGLQIEKDFPGALVSHRGGQGGRSF